MRVQADLGERFRCAGSAWSVSRGLPRAGRYFLVISNCGDMEGARVTGDIVARNPHGYLPGDEVRAKPARPARSSARTVSECGSW